jgi:hypothetical protein
MGSYKLLLQLALNREHSKLNPSKAIMIRGMRHQCPAKKIGFLEYLIILGELPYDRTWLHFLIKEQTTKRKATIFQILLFLVHKGWNSQG